MRCFTIRALVCATALFTLFTYDIQAQSNAPVKAARANSEDTMQELLNEVRQLRVALQRMTVNGYRTQIMVERLRLQHEGVTRLTQELNAVRNDLRDIKSTEAGLKEKTEYAEQQKEAGVIPPSEVMALKAAIEDVGRREQQLTDRETQVSIQLNTERANLDDLNKRLDALERELIILGMEREPAEKKKR